MQPNHFYHIYNRGNNRQKIFFREENYIYFIEKIKHHLVPHIEIVAYCLMPNHFHFLAYTTDSFKREEFSEELRIMLSSYTRGINKQESRVGSLFQQNSKIKLLEGTASTGTLAPASICFHYIHQNPLKASLVDSFTKWKMSSYHEYLGLEKIAVCNKQIAYDYLDIPKDSSEFEELSKSLRL